MMETPVTHFLDERGVSYEPVALDSSVRTAADAAAAGGTALAQIVKTMVLVGRGKAKGLVFALLRGDQRLSVRAVADAVGRPLKLLSMYRVEARTGYEPGCVAPFGLTDGPFPIVADAGIFDYDTVEIGSGDRRLGLRVQTKDLLALVGGTAYEIAKA